MDKFTGMEMSMLCLKTGMNSETGASTLITCGNTHCPTIVYAVHKSVGMRCCKSATTVCSRYLLIALQDNDVDDKLAAARMT